MASICHHLFSSVMIKNFLTPTHNYGTRAPELYNRASVWLGRIWLGRIWLGLVGGVLSVSMWFDWGRGLIGGALAVSVQRSGRDDRQTVGGIWTVLNARGRGCSI